MIGYNIAIMKLGELQNSLIFSPGFWPS